MRASPVKQLSNRLREFVTFTCQSAPVWKILESVDRLEKPVQPRVGMGRPVREPSIGRIDIAIGSLVNPNAVGHARRFLEIPCFLRISR